MKTNAFFIFSASTADNFTECVDPNSLTFGQPCVPFRTITNITDQTTQKILASTLFGVFKCENICPQTSEKLVSKLWFNIYKECVHLHIPCNIFIFKSFDKH